MPGDAEAYFDRREGENRDIADMFRDLVFDVWPDETETIQWPVPTYMMVGMNTVYIEDERAYVKLGLFNRGSLDAPDGVLEVTGKMMHHIKFLTSEAVRSDAVRSHVEESGALARQK